MSLFDNGGEPARVEIPPGTDLGIKEPSDAERKRREAILFLGDRWCLARTRAAQLEDMKNNCEDLI